MAPFKRKRRFPITPGGLGFLLVCVLLTLGAINAGLNMIYLLACLLISTAIAGLAGPLWNTGRLDCRGAQRGEAYANEPFDVDLWIASRRRTAAHMLFFEYPKGGTGTGAGESARGFVRSVKPGERLRISCRLKGRGRGVHPFPEITLGSRFPFGMAECRLAKKSSDGELLVFPARGRLAGEIERALLPRGLREGRRAGRGFPSNEFHSVREYRPGDSPRNIHWRVTAHRGELAVKEMERERPAPVALLLDSRVPRSTPSDRRAETEKALELAIAFAAEVCRATVKTGGAVRLLAFHPEPRIVTVGATDFPDARGGRTADMRRLLETLARLTPSDAEDASALVALLGHEAESPASRTAAVTPTHETAAGIRSQPGGRAARIYVAGDASMASYFRLLAPEERAP